MHRQIHFCDGTYGGSVGQVGQAGDQFGASGNDFDGINQAQLDARQIICSIREECEAV
jgi:hypothetical protein